MCECSSTHACLWASPCIFPQKASTFSWVRSGLEPSEPDYDQWTSKPMHGPSSHLTVTGVTNLCPHPCLFRWILILKPKSRGLMRQRQVTNWATSPASILWRVCNFSCMKQCFIVWEFCLVVKHLAFWSVMNFILLNQEHTHPVIW